MTALRLRWRRWLLRILISIVVLIAAGAVVDRVCRVPPRATVLIFVEPVPLGGLSQPEFDDAEFRHYCASQLVMIKHPDLFIEPALKNLGKLSLLKDRADPVAYVASRLNVSWPGEGSFIAVSFADYTRNPDELAHIVHTVVSEYVYYVHEFEKRKSSEEEHYLQSALESHLAELDAAEQTLVELQIEKEQIADREAQMSALLQKRAQLQVNPEERADEIERLEEQIAQYSERTSAVSQKAISVRVWIRQAKREFDFTKKVVETLQWRLEALQMQRDEARVRVSSMGPAKIEKGTSLWLRLIGE